MIELCHMDVHTFHQVEQVASHLEESGVNVGTVSHDASFRKSKSSLTTDHGRTVKA